MSPAARSGERTVALSLVSHTNVGKTTLARTLLESDVGVVRDEPHVTDAAEHHTLVETAAGEALLLWDTPGFGDSVRLARRLEQSRNPIGWVVPAVWDRFNDRPFWSSQQAVRNVREQADVVLYLVNAAEDPQQAGYVLPEMRVLEWIGRPVIVLLNQLGAPKAHDVEEREVQRWRAHLGAIHCVSDVLAFDAFARCWVQEITLLRAIEPVLAAPQRATFDHLRDAWVARRQATFDSAMQVLAERVARAAVDREAVDDAGMRGRLRELGAALGISRNGEAGPRQAAMQRLAQRLDASIRDGTDRLIRLHGLGGHATDEVLARLADHYAVRNRLSEGKAAFVGGIITGALTGLKADLAAGGMTFGAGLLAGGVLGALGAAGLARGFNLLRGTDVTSLAWTDEVLNQLVVSALLGYLAVAHYGRGRGDWKASESPAHWQDEVSRAVDAAQLSFQHLWSMRTEPPDMQAFTTALNDTLTEITRAVLSTLYPGTLAGDLSANTAPSPAVRG